MNMCEFVKNLMNALADAYEDMCTGTCEEGSFYSADDIGIIIEDNKIAIVTPDATLGEISLS